jgi:hypothetical protein
MAVAALESKLLIVEDHTRHTFSKNFVDEFAKVAEGLGLILGTNFFVTRGDDATVQLIIAGEHAVQKVIDEVKRRGISIADMPVFKNRNGMFTASFTKMEFMHALRYGIATVKHLDPKRVVFAKMVDSAWIAKVSTLAAVSDTPAMRELLKQAA